MSPSHQSSPPGRRDNSAELADALLGAARALRRGFHTALEPAGLSPHHARALRVLAHANHTRDNASQDSASQSDGVRISELAAALRIAPRSATEVVDGLADRGLAERRADPADRRAVVVVLTEAGREAVAHAERARTRAAAELFGTLTDDERASLTALLRRLPPDAAVSDGGGRIRP
ncbi:DNA-binding transcriptional regulator, MarR family [Quadrisphaera granulorum]|uniref:DNA-binding MarR family transcriptional regulator n=1 Tax=Quadrisphaera granulorum TaxID=317664 RepID=A0A315ZPC4_9ACTN|nr:MarR family winged helix-turn-helix transcriptional regulator [Quadrisphaera granulorum]PWJ47485.1 DNA-binding MarR family transcriptional regulator [Quadrisphaera granulorum]SZE98786.1 DNA-binding transcriptional regulator, MarR family [Quadrisphaera granulorum]